MAPSESRSDRLALHDGILRYENNDKLIWELRAADIVLIAEWTNGDGPWRDDYFYQFAAGTPPVLFEAPMYAGPSRLDDLGRSLGAVLRVGLCASTDLRSRVIWPPRLEGHELFSTAPRLRPSSVVNRIKDRIFPLVDMELTPEVTKYLALLRSNVNRAPST